MAEENLEAKLKHHLKQDKIQLWNPPYTNDNNEPGKTQMQDLAEGYAPMVGFAVSEVGSVLEAIRAQTVKRGQGNKAFKETCVATLELMLPRDGKKETKKKNYLETKLDFPVQEIMNSRMATWLYVMNGLHPPEQRLDEQGVRNNSKIMVLRVNEEDRRRQITEEEQKKNQKESIDRTQKGFQILSERDGSEDPETTPFLEIADQKGNPLQIPHEEKKALILAMGFHEKGRSLLKRKQHDNALCHLLQADQQFGRCGSALLTSVDNYAVLQLDIVWCYQALEALSCLDDGKMRLQKAEDCFLHCYGEQQQRLLMIKGSQGREEVLFLRLYLLQSLLSYVEGNDSQAAQQLQKVESLYSRLCPDLDKMTQLMSLGFSEREARLGLRACQGDIEEAAMHITNRRQEREALKEREEAKRSSRLEAVAVLTEMGYSRADASRALHQAQGDVNRAYALLYLGFERQVSETALRLTDGDLQLATHLLLDNQGVLSPDLLSASPPSSPSEEHSSSSDDPKDRELVNEVLEDISRHEEDYLDLTLEEESELIATMKSYLSRGNAHAV
uniref:Negative regulator of ubiquitin-like proteins 1 n=1 Tax=Gadus morhua TaxID=8049 RepID=A0A8C5FMA9_GADMO